MTDTLLAQRRRYYEVAALERERADFLRGLRYGLVLSTACWAVIGLAAYAVMT